MTFIIKFLILVKDFNLGDPFLSFKSYQKHFLKKHLSIYAIEKGLAQILRGISIGLKPWV